MSFNVIRKNKILTNITELTVMECEQYNEMTDCLLASDIECQCLTIFYLQLIQISTHSSNEMITYS